MKRFPILGTSHWIPWEMIEPHEKTAQKNHSGQSLQRLAERLGLTFVEAYAVLTDTHWHDFPKHVNEEFAQTEINKMMLEYFDKTAE